MSGEHFYTQDTLPHVAREETFETEELPAKIGPYKIESLLTKGGMSILYLGLHPKTGDHIVVKVLSPRFASMPEVVSQFLSEAEVISMTDHPNIIKLYGQGEWENGLYIAMEFIGGISLKQFINQQTLSLKSSLEVALQVAYALLHLHTHGVIHRDLKPENILIAEDGQVKVIDFGISQLINQGSALKGGPGQLIGTPSYMSPEQKQDPKSVTFATDIYALGVITYELILGRLSYGTIQLALLPKGMQRIIKKCLEPSLDDRYQDIVDFITDVSNYLKSDSMKKDRPSGDEVAEVLEQVSASHAKLLPPSLPKWSQVDIGLSSAKNIASLGLFYDFLKFPSGEHFIYMGEFDTREVEALAYIGQLKGMIQTLFAKAHNDSTVLINLPSFLHDLNQLVYESSYLPSSSFGALLFSADCEDFSLALLGLEHAYHTNFGSQDARVLQNDHPKLGEIPENTFEALKDGWNEGDLLHFHTFTNEKATASLPEFIKEYRNLSPEKQAESLFRKLSGPSNDQSCHHGVLTIQRIR
ncbi:MAG: Serine/threonine-protein kinase PknD [Chlamydiia bacterium]|nr:Serine/threonine-protein kinase PknD [Chlamydiia bacterium]MCH9616629.1 Serine/threonine-protein kinase PknD [Chlamydiia bacterium]MCH9629360.1 Serine/threonine-protein kinase PknD [Chlamydiia bacterium]